MGGDKHRYRGRRTMIGGRSEMDSLSEPFLWPSRMASLRQGMRPLRLVEILASRHWAAVCPTDAANPWWWGSPTGACRSVGTVQRAAAQSQE